MGQLVTSERASTGLPIVRQAVSGLLPRGPSRWHYSGLARTALGYEETLRHEREQYEAGDFPDEEARLGAKERLENLLARRGPTLFDTIVNILQERGVVLELF
jgi:hypothetical protein